MKYCFLLLLPLVLIVACTPDLTRPSAEPPRYVLHPLPAKEASQHMPITIRMARPQVAAGLDNDRIAIIRDGRVLHYAADARWAGNLRHLLEKTLTQSLENQLGVLAMSHRALETEANYKLLFELTDFQADYSTSAMPQLVVGFRLSLLSMPHEKPLYHLHFSESIPAEADRLLAIIAGLEALLHQGLWDAIEAIKPIIAGKGGV